MIRKIFILALGLVALMAMPAAAQYGTTTTTEPTTTTTAPTDTVPGTTATTVPTTATTEPTTETTEPPAACTDFLRDDAYTTPVNTPITPAPPGILGNDDICSPFNGYTILSTTSHGSVTPNTNGSFTYTPDAGYIGTDSFVYQANHDGNSRKGARNGDTATVTITITDDNGVGGESGNQGGNTGGGTLVRTGSNTDELVKLGGLLLVIGGAFTLVAGKRRRRTAA